MIAPETLAQWDELASKAAPEPWTSCKKNRDCLIDAGVYSNGIRLATTINPLGERSSRSFDVDANAEFIAAARQALPATIAELRACHAELATYQSATNELLELLREAWNCQNTDALTLFLTALIGGIRAEWLKAMPENGFVCATVFPDIGKVEIAIRRIDGKSASEVMRELQAENERLKAEISRLHLNYTIALDGRDHTIRCLQADLQPEDTFAAGTNWQKEGK